MKDIAGVSAFGLNSSVFQSGKYFCEDDYYLTDAVLPMNPFGRIRTGKEAEDERIHTGLYWPPETRISGEDWLRRVPVSYAWRAFVEAGDSMVRWNAGHGVYFPLSRIIAGHIANLLNKANNIGSVKEKIQTVVTIPNNLDEFGQEALLSEIKRLGYEAVTMVWRPVAAALAWLDKVEGDFPQHMHQNDHIHIIYLGSDALEFTTFRLRVKESKNRLYVLPLRDRPTDLPCLTGMDWAGNIIENSCCGTEQSSFWQAFTNFPEIWQAIAGREWVTENLPRPWFQGNSWGLWDPPDVIRSKIYDSHASQATLLRKILKKSCPLASSEQLYEVTIGEYFQREVHRLTELLPGGTLRGMIICGALAPREIPPWIKQNRKNLLERGLDIYGDLNKPKVGHLWLCDAANDSIAEGASIYGDRTASGIPSYLDTLPQISILAQGQGQYIWVPLLKPEEVLGGDDYTDRISDKFQLRKGGRKLNAYLCKGPLENTTVGPRNTSDSMERLSQKAGNYPQARLIREVVRRLGSMDKVESNSFFSQNSRPAKYGLEYARAFYRKGNCIDDGPDNSTIEGKSNTPYRKTVFEFPSAPETDVTLDVEVRMRPASGLARVELIPDKPNFLHGRRVLVNYSKMHKTTQLPQPKLGWPSIQEIIVHPEDELLLKGRTRKLVRDLEASHPKFGNYENIIENLKNMLSKKEEKKFYGVPLDVYPIDIHGMASTPKGSEIITTVSEKLQRDFTIATHKIRNKIFLKASRLYTSTPDNIVKYVRNIIEKDFNPPRWRYAVEAGSRFFKTEEEYRFLFKNIERRARFAQQPTYIPFPIESARAICRVLMYRRNGERGLHSDMANLFVKCASRRLRQVQRKQNFSIIYFQVIQLLLYLLRYRKADPTCFNPNSNESIQPFIDAMESMEDGILFFKRQGQNDKASKVQEIKKGFEKYLHYEGEEDLPMRIREFAGDGTE